MSNLTSRDYWQSRAERLILAGEKSANEMTADLQKVYRDTYNGIQKEIDAFYGKYSTEQGITLTEAQKRLNKSELKEFKSQMQAYYDAIEATDYAYDPLYKQRLSRLLSAKAYIGRLEALQEQVQNRIENLYMQQNQRFTEGMGTVYEDSYYRSIFDIQQGTGVGSPFSTLNDQAILTATKQKWLGENYSDRIWSDKDRMTVAMNRIIPQGIALGQNPRVIGREISKQLGTRRAYAERLARTEFNFIANEASGAAYSEAGIERYQYLATLDTRTSEECSSLDNKIFNVSDKIAGVNWPPAHPNCRSTTIPYFAPDEIDALFEQSERIARNPKGKNYLVPANMKYSDWKKERGIM